MAWSWGWRGPGDEWLVFVILVGLGLCSGPIAMGHVP